MRIGLVVDAGCDLSDEIIAEEDVVVLPIAVRIGALRGRSAMLWWRLSPVTHASNNG